MQRVLVVGCPGAGKSVFARKLSAVTGLPLYYLDLLWHRPDRTTASEEEFDGRLREILREEHWIVDGNYLRTFEQRISVCDAVLYLDIPGGICFEGVRARLGRPREDLPWLEDSLDDEFQRWIEDFPFSQKPRIEKCLQRFREGRAITVFHDRAESDLYIEHLRRP